MDRIEKTDQKAISLFRSNILLLGLILTALSIVVQSETNQVGPFINVCSLFGVGFLLLSTFLAAMAYTSSSIDVGLDPDLLADGDGHDLEQFYSDVADSYEQGLAHNSNVDSFNAILVTGAILCVYDAIILLLGGAVVGTFGLKFTYESIALLAFLLALATVLNLGIYYGERLFMAIFPE